MEPASLRALIRQKLVDGRLPQEGIPSMWGGRSHGETCDACEEVIDDAQFVMEGMSTDGSTRALQFHVACFYLWDAERSASDR